MVNIIFLRRGFFVENLNNSKNIRTEISKILPHFGVVDSTIEIIEDK